MSQSNAGLWVTCFWKVLNKKKLVKEITWREGGKTGPKLRPFHTHTALALCPIQRQKWNILLYLSSWKLLPQSLQQLLLWTGIGAEGATITYKHNFIHYAHFPGSDGRSATQTSGYSAPFPLDSRSTTGSKMLWKGREHCYMTVEKPLGFSCWQMPARFS